jgi:hypothetical protein
MNPFPWDATSGTLESRLICGHPVPAAHRHELDDVMLVANLSRALLPAFSSTVRFQRFIAVDGIALIYPAVSAKHVLPAYPGFSALNDLRESASFTHSSCPRQVVFVSSFIFSSARICLRPFQKARKMTSRTATNSNSALPTISLCKSPYCGVCRFSKRHSPFWKPKSVISTRFHYPSE